MRQRLQNMSAVCGFVQNENKNVERNETKTMVAFTMALITLILATAADARSCGGPLPIIVGVRAGTLRKAFPLNYGSCFPGLKSPAIIEGPHNGTAVLQPEGIVVVYLEPGFTGKDPMKVRFSLPTRGTIGSPEPQFTTVTQTYVIWVY
jgi:hypothetical protein